MLQSNVQRTEKFSVAPSEGGLDDMVGFALGLLNRQYKIIIAAMVLVTALAFAYVRITPPTYTAQTQILLKSPKAQSVKQESPLAESTLDAIEIETQLQLLQSPATAVAVIKQLDLAEDPDFGVSDPFAPIRQMFRGPASPRTSEARDHAGQEPRGTAGAEVEEGLISAFLSRLKAHRVELSNIIEVSYSSRSAKRAAEVVNAVADAYIKEQLNAKFEASRSATAWLQDRLRDLGDKARAEELSVDSYRIQHNLMSSGGKPVNDQQVGDLTTRMIAARAQTSDALARLNRYEALLRADSPVAPSAEMMGGMVSDALTSPIINTLRTEFLELQRRDAEWSSRYGENHQAVRDLRARMREVRNSIREEVRRLAETSRSDYDMAKKRQQELEKLFGDVVTSSRTTNSAELALRDMESRAKGYRNLYETFQQRYMGAVQQENFPLAEARVIYPARPPESKSKPKSMLIMALGAFGGLALGVGLGLFREMTDRVFRAPAQVESALQLPCLSVVPRISAPIRRRDDNPEPRKLAALAARAVSNRNTIDSQVIGMPLSRFTETIRSAKIGIDLNPSKTSNKVIGVTSALPGEGKTTIAVALARLIAHGGGRVIIVDCDLRRPSLSKQLAPDATFGLAEVVFGERALEDALWRDPKTNFALLPAVSRRPPFHSCEMLASEATQRLFEKLRASFDYVIVDLPPLAPVVDARATASFVDCHLLVVEWGQTKIDVVRHALHNAPNVYENLVGVVLNNTDMRQMAHYDRRRHDYYDERYYDRYNANEPQR